MNEKQATSNPEHAQVPTISSTIWLSVASCIAHFIDGTLKNKLYGGIQDLTYVLGAALMLPLIHVAIASLSKRKRNSASRRRIFRGWAYFNIIAISLTLFFALIPYFFDPNAKSTIYPALNRA